MEPNADWPEWLSSLYTFLGGGGFASATYAFFKWFLPWKYKNNKETEESHFKLLASNIDYIYQTLNETVSSLKLDRILIMQAHNGGGDTSVKVPIYSSIRYEACSSESHYTNSPIFPIKETWQNQLLDAEYAQMLRNLLTDGSVVLVTKDLPESALRDVYETSGVTASCVYLIHEEDKKSLWYISLTTSKPDFEVDAEWRNYVRIVLSRLRPLFQEGSV